MTAGADVWFGAELFDDEKPDPFAEDSLKGNAGVRVAIGMSKYGAVVGKSVGIGVEIGASVTTEGVAAVSENWVDGSGVALIAEELDVVPDMSTAGFWVSGFGSSVLGTIVDGENAAPDDAEPPPLGCCCVNGIDDAGASIDGP